MHTICFAHDVHTSQPIKDYYYLFFLLCLETAWSIAEDQKRCIECVAKRIKCTHFNSVENTSSDSQLVHCNEEQGLVVSKSVKRWYNRNNVLKGWGAISDVQIIRLEKINIVLVIVKEILNVAENRSPSHSTIVSFSIGTPELSDRARMLFYKSPQKLIRIGKAVATKALSCITKNPKKALGMISSPPKQSDCFQSIWFWRRYFWFSLQGIAFLNPKLEKLRA